MAAAVVLALITFAAKFCYLRALPVSTDEPQHLHVAWGWTQGMVQYRDFFDNHTPLFHLLAAPLVAWIGERADILFWMRLSMLPLYLLCLGFIYCLGRSVFCRRTAVWGTLLGATCPVFLFTSSQFRTDVLWMTVWLATLATAFAGRFTRGRAFASGLLLGTAFAVSMKTSLLSVSLLAAVGTAAFFSSSRERRSLFAGSIGLTFAGLAGVVIVPLAVVAYFGNQHALDSFVYCVITHNTLPAAQGWTAFFRHWILFPALLPLTLWVGWKAMQAGADRSIALRRAMVLLTAAFFLLFLYCFWPMVTPQDLLPVVPLAALALTPRLFALARGRGSVVKHLPAVLVAVQLAIAAKMHKPGSDQLSINQQLVADILRLTRPGEFVMDAKGETLFRQRPFYYVLENIAQRRIELGSIADTVAADMAKHQTCVAILQRMPEASLQWARRFYLPVTNRIHVAGCLLSAVPPAEPRRFEVGVAAEYIVVSERGPVQGMMDGAPCSGPVFLPAGAHTFVSGESGPLAVIWARAAQTGFRPLPMAFHPLP